MQCPRCGQGEIEKINIKRINKPFFVCDECDATWFAIEDIGKVDFVDFETELDDLGFAKGDRSAVVGIEKILD